MNESNMMKISLPPYYEIARSMALMGLPDGFPISSGYIKSLEERGHCAVGSPPKRKLPKKPRNPRRPRKKR
jgi:hypothetical protein